MRFCFWKRRRPDPAVESGNADLDALDRYLRKLERLVAMARTFEETLAQVTLERTRIGSLKALIAGLKQQVADALSGTTLPADAQAKLDAIFDEASGGTADADAALNTNVPPATPPA